MYNKETLRKLLANAFTNGYLSSEETFEKDCEAYITSKLSAMSEDDGQEGKGLETYTQKEVIDLLKHIREYDDFYNLVDEDLLETFVPSYTEKVLNRKPLLPSAVKDETNKGASSAP